MGGHWYNSKGEACYTQPKANGRGERATTLRDARKLHLVPSVTTVMQCAAKPGLDAYKTRQLLEAAMLEPYDALFDDPKEFKQRTIIRSKMHAKEAADRGTEIHDALELWIKTGEVKEEHQKYIDAVDECLSCLPDLDWRAEDSFCHALGFGGKVDLSCGDGEGFIIDFKTKATSDKFAVYDEHAMQLAAYGRGLGMPDAVCFNLFISTEEDDVKTELIEHSPGDIERGWQMFEHLLYFWQLKNKYKPEV